MSEIQNTKFSPTEKIIRKEMSGQNPELTIACMADLHIDYGIQNYQHPNRESTVEVCQELAKEEHVDLVLVGGDTVSSNDRRNWDFATFSRVRKVIHSDLQSATYTKRVIYANGNHDYQVGAKKGFNSYDYEDLMVQENGIFNSIYYQKDDPTLRNQIFPENILAFYYHLMGVDFIILNQPYSSRDISITKQFYSEGTIAWLDKTLNSLVDQNSREVFIVTHYPLRDSRNMVNRSDLPKKTHVKLKHILTKYKSSFRIIWLYGHFHGFDSGKRRFKHDSYINTDTFQRITPYSEKGKVIHKRDKLVDGMVSCFMGSLTYFKNKFNKYRWLSEKTPAIIQVLLIYVFSDRIVFQMKNYGEQHGGSQILLPYVIPRVIETN